MDAPRDFGALLERAAGLWPETEALVFPASQLTDARWTYARLASEARNRHDQLRALGIGAGDRVAVVLPNGPDFIAWLGGIALRGAVAVPLNPRYRDAELDFALGDSGSTAVVTASDAGPTTALTRRHTTTGLLRVPAGVALLMYTSGTTAEPKGCLLHHATWLRAARAMAEDRYRLRGGDRLWNPLPMFHMAALHPFAACATVGATFVGMLRFDAALGLQQIADEQIDVLYAAFPTILADLVHAPGFDDARLARVRRINCVGAPDTLRTLQAALPAAALTSVYGLTEAGGVVAYGLPDEPLDVRVGTCGRPFDGIAVRIAGADGRELPTGGIGELQLRGWCLFAGYWGRDDATARALTADGWLRTGDRCALDSAGRIVYHGRLKDVLKVGGENVSAVEVESILARHAAVKLAQVVGAPDARLGEVPVAFVELRHGATANAAELIAHCRESLASFKVPRQVRFVTEWPMSATKIQKQRLLALLEQAT